jgi:transposase
MKFYTKTHQYYCGIDLHAKNLYVCILDSEGAICVHKNIGANPEALLKLIQPYRHAMVLGVECMFTWYWVADFCEEQGIEFVLGHALYMKAIHGGKAKNDKIDSHKIAVLLRGGMFPQAYVYPAELRGTRDLLRRRMHRMRKRAELLSHVQNTNSQYNLPEIAKNLRYAFNREGVAERFSDASVQKNIELDLALIGFYDEQLGKVEWHCHKTAKAFDYQRLMLLRSVPGIGEILSLVILYEVHDFDRFPRVQDFVSYCRLVKCKKESAGKTYGTSGGKTCPELVEGSATRI